MSDSLEDVALARRLLGYRVVTPDALKECLFQVIQERKTRPARPLVESLLSRGLVTPAALSMLPPDPPTRMYLKSGEDNQIELDRALGAYLKQKGIVRRDALRNGQSLQSEFDAYGLKVPLLEILKRENALSWQQEQQLRTVDLRPVVNDPDWKNQVVPGYRFLGRVASGGYATIWTAQPLFGGPSVAIKVLHPERERNPRAVARFEWEAVLMRRLACPNIVRGIDNGVEKGRHYLIMEFVEGKTLGQILQERGAFAPVEAIRTVRPIAEALRYLHAEGYLHRDIKPDNVLVDRQGSIKLCDLGFVVAIPTEDAIGKRAGTAVGTTGYMAPEVRQGAADAKVGTDIYSLGILLYALLSGDVLSFGASSEEGLVGESTFAPPAANLSRIRAPEPVLRLLARMIEPDRTRRFASVPELIAALDGLSAGL